MDRRSLLMALAIPGLVACTGATASPTPTAAAVAKPATAAASPLPSPSAAAPSPSAVGATTAASSGAPAPTATSSALPETVWIGGTGGSGVYLRNSPNDGDRAVVLADGTSVGITGEQVEGDGKQWWPITTANNDTGYVQIEYVVRTEPTAPPAPPTGAPK